MPRFFVSLAFVIAAALSAAPESLTWSSESFQKRFLGSYGFDGPREPKISPNEQLTLQALTPLLESGQYTNAARQLQESLSPDSSAALDYTLGNLYRQTGEVALAESAYRQALKKAPGFARASQNLGLLLLQEGRFGDAIAPLGQAIERGADNSTNLGALAYCHFRAEDYAAALRGYEQAAFLDAANADWQLGRAQCLIQLERATEALGVAERYLEKFPSHIEARRIAVNASLAMEDRERTAAHLELLRRQNQADAAALLLLGRTYLALKLPERAAEAFLAALNLEQKPSIEELLAAAELLAREDRTDETESLLAIVYQKYGESLSGEAMNQLLRLQARLKLQAGDSAAAARLAKQATMRDPLDGRALLLLGEAEREEENWVEAQIAFEQATKLDEIAADAWLELARLHVEQQQWQAAIDALREAQIIRPEDRVAEYLQSIERIASQ